MTKYIFVTGGVVSSIGKGITTACLGRLLKSRGFRVTLQKIDPYLNVDAGTMNPHQHGEVFVTEDGAETDLDLGHYERFVDINLSRDCNVTTGRVYGDVIAKERHGDYLGKTVQVIPHVTDEIKAKIRKVAEDGNADFAIVEVGGTVGDIEGQPFLEAIRQFAIDEGRENCLYIHVTLVPFVGPRRELKTKPTQHSIRELRGIGIQPDVLLCRSKLPLTDEMLDKISLFCNVSRSAIVQGLDTQNVYELPLVFERQGLASLVLKRLGVADRPVDLSEWQEIADVMNSMHRRCRVAMVGKYVELHDAYISIFEALKHGGLPVGAEVETALIDSEKVEERGAEALLKDADAILVPGGFGDRGIEGKIATIRYAREKQIPFLGLCLGLQCAVIEFARHVCGLEGANSKEFDESTPHPVIDMLPDQLGVEDKGGTMRRGGWPCVLEEGSMAAQLYGETAIRERHRHRFEVNPEYHAALVEHGLRLAGRSPNGTLVELIELPDHPFFLACQFHPEFKSRPTRPHPMFKGFVAAAVRAAAQRGSRNITAA